MLDTFSKSFFHALAGSGTLKSLASRYGMRHTTSFARRFIAGETLDEAVRACRDIQARGLLLTLDQLGESVTSVDEAAAATRNYLGIVERIVASGIERNTSGSTACHSRAKPLCRPERTAWRPCRRLCSPTGRGVPMEPRSTGMTPTCFASGSCAS